MLYTDSPSEAYPIQNAGANLRRSVGEDCFISLDFGTSSNRVVVFDTRGTLLWQASDSTVDGGNGILEGGEIIASLRRLLRLAGDRTLGLNVVGIGVSAQLGMVLLDEEGGLLGPITTWRDRSAIGEADLLTHELGREWIYHTAGRQVDPELNACKLLRLRLQSPGVFRKIRWVLSLKDYLVHVLTGAFTIDPAHASYSMLADVSRLGWSAELLQSVRIPEQCLPVIQPGTALAGTLTRAVAQESGLPEGTPVAVGGPDGTVGSVGARMLLPGTAIDLMGTTDVLLVATDRPCFHPAGATLVNAHVLPGLWVVGGPMTTTGGALQWVSESILGDRPENVAARLATLEHAARSIPPGSDGLFGIPSLIGERAPFWDPQMKAAFVGLRLQHGPAHIYRALVEGAAFLVSIHLEAVCQTGTAVDRIVLAGGGSRSELACQIRADVFRRNVSICPVAETTSLGAAVLAAVASGYYSNAEEAGKAMFRPSETLACSSEAVNYEPCMDSFRTVHRVLREFHSRLLHTYA